MKRTRVAHPFLFSLFPILALYAYNVRSIPVSPSELALPLAASVGGTALLYLVLRTALKIGKKSDEEAAEHRHDH